MQIHDDGDTIFLADLRVRAIIGINDWERRVRQTISVDLTMPANAQRAARSDNIDDTLNYKAVAKRLIGFISESEYQLVETLAERLAEIVLTEFGVSWARVSVHKPGAVRGARDVGITITRGKPIAAGGVTEVYVGAGSNVDPQINLKKALAAMEQRFGPLRRSTIYRNAAVGFDGDDFLNMVIGFETSETLEAVSGALSKIEQDCGRTRDGSRFASRTLDLDLLLMGQQISDGAEFQLPRAELLQQAFMLRPLAELAGPFIHPVEKRPLADIWRDSDDRDHVMTPVDLDG